MASTRMSLADLISGNKVGWQALKPFFKSIGVDEYREQEGTSESTGEAMYSQALTPEAMRKAAGYTFEWKGDGPANTGSLTAYDPAGKAVGSYKQQDKTAGQTLANYAKVAAVAAGGLGAIGIGPLAGTLGGAGAGTAGSAGTGIGAAGTGELAAYGATLTPAEVAATATGLDLGAGAGAGSLASAGTTGVNAMRAGELAGYATNGALPSSAATAGKSAGLFGSLTQDALTNMGIKAATVGVLGAAGNAMAPDKPNEAAIGAAAANNAGIATQMQGIADQQKDLFAEFRPVLQDLITKNVTAQDLSTQRSNDAWASYTNTWKPVGDALAQKSLDWASPGRAAQEAQTAATGVAGQYDQARASSREAMIRAGLDPTAMASLESAGRLSEAKDTAGAANTARRGVEKEGMAYLDNAARFGTTVAGLSQDQARLAQTQGQGVAAGVANLSGAANAPLVPLNAAVSANNSTVANQVGLFNAKSNQTNDRNAVIGDVVGAGMSAIGSAGGWQNFFKP